MSWHINASYLTDQKCCRRHGGLPQWYRGREYHNQRPHGRGLLHVWTWRYVGQTFHLSIEPICYKHIDMTFSSCRFRRWWRGPRYTDRLIRRGWYRSFWLCVLKPPRNAYIGASTGLRALPCQEVWAWDARFLLSKRPDRTRWINAYPGAGQAMV